MTPEDFAPVPSSEIHYLSSRAGRVITDCFPGAEIEFLRKKNSSSSSVLCESVVAKSGNYVIRVGLISQESSSKVIVSSYYVGQYGEFTSSSLYNPSFEEIREALVNVCVKSFKDYCLVK